ncbi:MAG TPA: UbiH/UbiF/VisC/COQ6 family ubiquinone biosynthesis hydroxylase [Rickettsiales bacterium]|nr:UbiH/UbiF/VisC/COQ6 family ubiquinone biosynthesis hydroxylase [Rickettsiales bacterium]
MNNPIHHTDILIVGGGMVGLTLAIALAQEGVQATVIEKEDMASQVMPEFDGRVSAISLGSERVLRAAGIWQYMQPYAQPILDIRVADGDSTAHVHYNYRDVGDEPVGNMVENRHTRLALMQRVKELPSLKLLAPMQVKSMERDAYGVSVTLSDGSQWRAPLIVAADGKRSKLRAEVGIGTIERGYKQMAIVCTIEHELPHEGLAIQRFLPVGPFAALPMQGNRSALVWSEDETLAPDIVKLPEEAFHAEIAKRLGTHLGNFKQVGKRFCYPLHLVLAKRYVDSRFALIGDSAHAIHPIAGQGVNVGFRDVAVLAELVVDALRLGLDIGSADLLAHYQRWRRFDAMSMGAIMDGLTRLFSNDITPLRLARDMGLDIVNHAPPLKRIFMRHAMGLMGDLPRMMQDAA